MSALACKNKHSIDQATTLPPLLTEAVSPHEMEDLDFGEEQKDNRIEKQELRNPMDEIDIEEDDDCISPCATVVPSNTPVTGDSGHVSPTMENSLDSLSDGTQQPQDAQGNCDISETVETVNVAATLTPVNPVTSRFSIVSREDARDSQNSEKVHTAVKDDKREEKKKNRKKEDKSGEHILRALNSLQSPEEKLAALCKKFADLHAEHRVLQTSFKTQQRTLTAVVREKDQLQSEHTKAMMAKSKLESLCRELQKHNKIIENESIKRAKDSDDKRKEISSHFHTTISEIQSQMSDNSEKNNLLRTENDNLAEQLRTFMSQCQARDEHVKKLQEQHDLENKLAAARLAQAEAIIREVEERGNKEKELMLLKLSEMTKKAHLTESQLDLYKSKYDEFNDLHSRSSETFQKYKTEMDKMTKRIKKLEKDGLQWKTKWETASKALLEQHEAKSKSEWEASVCAQKVKKLESLCRALQVELHRKKVVDSESGQENEQPNRPTKDDTTSVSTVPPSSDMSSSSESSPALIEPPFTSTTPEDSMDLTPCPLILSPTLAPSPVHIAAAEPGSAEKDIPCLPNASGTDVIHLNCGTQDKTHTDVSSPFSLLTPEVHLSGDETKKLEGDTSEEAVSGCMIKPPLTS